MKLRKYLKFLSLRRRAGFITETKDDSVVIVACVNCGFDYVVRRINFGNGNMGALWLCGCTTRYVPPGGEVAHLLVR